jgi:hypothetical protein
VAVKTDFLKPLKLPPYLYDTADITVTSNNIHIWPGQPHNWETTPVRQQDKLPIFWTNEKIRAFNPFIGDPLEPYFYRSAPEVFAQSHTPVQANLRCVLFGGRALEATFTGMTLTFSTLSNIIASIGAATLDSNHITLSSWAPGFPLPPFNLEASYFYIGMPAYTDVATDASFSAFSYSGVVDSTRFLGAEILVLTGTEADQLRLWYVINTAFGNKVFTETRAQQVANVKEMIKACKKFRMVHYVPNEAVWLDHFPSGGIVTFGEWSTSLNQAISDVGSSNVVAKYSSSLAPAPLGPRYDPADMVTEIKNFFNL